MYQLFDVAAIDLIKRLVASLNITCSGDFENCGVGTCAASENGPKQRQNS